MKVKTVLRILLIIGIIFLWMKGCEAIYAPVPLGEALLNDFGQLLTALGLLALAFLPVTLGVILCLVIFFFSWLFKAIGQVSDATEADLKREPDKRDSKEKLWDKIEE